MYEAATEYSCSQRFSGRVGKESTQEWAQTLDRVRNAHRAPSQLTLAHTSQREGAAPIDRYAHLWATHIHVAVVDTAY